MFWAFGEFELDGARFELRRAGERIPLQRKPLHLLIYLVQNRERTVPSVELVREIWPDVTVTEASLRRAIKGLRAALGGPESRFIESCRGYGYRFTGKLLTDFDQDGPSQFADIASAVRRALHERRFRVRRAHAVPIGIAEAAAAGWRLTFEVSPPSSER
jgi:DNA-binding winged helix-turn-helix (wHTH) protein